MTKTEDMIPMIDSMLERVYWNGHEETVSLMSLAQVEAIDRTTVDWLFVPATGMLSFCYPCGTRNTDPENWSGLGNADLRIIEVLQTYPGLYLTREAIADLGNYPALTNSKYALPTRVTAIRRFHAYDPEHLDAHFVETRPWGEYAIRWVPERTFMRIMLVTVPSSRNRPLVMEPPVSAADHTRREVENGGSGI